MRPGDQSRDGAKRYRKAVLDGMIDALCNLCQHRCNRTAGETSEAPTGIERQKSQEDAKSVTADVVYRQKTDFVRDNV